MKLSGVGVCAIINLNYNSGLTAPAHEAALVVTARHSQGPQ